MLWLRGNPPSLSFSARAKRAHYVRAGRLLFFSSSVKKARHQHFTKHLSPETRNARTKRRGQQLFHGAACLETIYSRTEKLGYAKITHISER